MAANPAGGTSEKISTCDSFVCLSDSAVMRYSCFVEDPVCLCWSVLLWEWFDESMQGVLLYQHAGQVKMNVSWDHGPLRTQRTQFDVVFGYTDT